MSEIEKLIHNPLRLLQLLSSKYSDISEEYESLYLDCIIYNKSSHYLSVFKEIAYFDFTEEYLKRFYKSSESGERIDYLADYYKNYHLFFCRPVFSNWKLTALMHNRCDTKAEIFYKKNYGNLNENQPERHVTNNESISSFDNVTNNQTIFDKKIRKRIDDNMATTMNLDNADISQCIHGSKLYTKRSVNESLRNIVSSLNVMKTAHERKGLKRAKNSRLSLKSSLCTLIKTKANSNGNANKNDYDKFLLSPKLRPFISNYHSNLMEFNKGKQEAANKILTSSNNQKYSMVIPNLSHKALITKSKKSNKADDSKSLTTNKSKKYVFTGMNQPNPSSKAAIDNNPQCLLNNHSKSNSQKNTLIANGKAVPHSCTYTNFILNAKNKRMNFIQSQRPSSSSKNGPFASSNMKISSMNTYNNYCLSNSNIFSTNNNKSNHNRNHQRNGHYHPNSLKKNGIQLQTHNTEGVSRNKQKDSRIVSIRTKNSNFQALTTTLKVSNSIEDQHNCIEMKTIIKELAKESDHNGKRFGTKLNDLLKMGSAINWIQKPKQSDKDRNKYIRNGQHLALHLPNSNSPKVMYPNKRNTSGESRFAQPLSKGTSQRKSKLNSPLATP